MPCFHYEGENDGGEAVTIPTNVEQVIVGPNLEILPPNAFLFCGSLVQVELGGGVLLKEIGESAFRGCHSLTNVEIPSSVERIRDLAFFECLSLAQVHLQEGLTTIGGEAFASCSSLEQISVPSTVESIADGAFARCESLVEANLHEGLKEIGSDVFCQCNALERMEIPSSVEGIGENLLSECTSLIGIQIYAKLLEIGRGFFFGCSSLPSIHIPESTENLAFGALWNCTALMAAQLPDGLLQIDDYAFRACCSLQAIAIPESVKMIGIRAFRSCISLVSVELPSHMNVSLMDEAFADCRLLVNIVVPPPEQDSGITAVAEDCFAGCTFLHYHFDRDNMAGSLVHRFDGFPVHKLCYYASSTVACELCQLASQMDDFDPILDPVGMSPFHVLLSAAPSRKDLLQVLLDLYPSQLIGQKDDCGRRATDYILGSNWTKESKSLLRIALEGWMLDWLSSSSESWKSDISRRVNEIVSEEDAEQRSRLLNALYSSFLQYQRIEVSSLVEIALWKQVLTSGQKSDNRGICRVRCGAPIVIPNVIAFL